MARFPSYVVLCVLAVSSTYAGELQSGKRNNVWNYEGNLHNFGFEVAVQCFTTPQSMCFSSIQVGWFCFAPSIVL
jgi:hypothetical protein